MVTQAYLKASVNSTYGLWGSGNFNMGSVHNASFRVWNKNLHSLHQMKNVSCLVNLVNGFAISENHGMNFQ